jgi:hypothetical protein
MEWNFDMRYPALCVLGTALTEYQRTADSRSSVGQCTVYESRIC